MIEINWNPPRRDLKIFAVLLVAFFGLIAAWVFWKYEAAWPAGILAAAAVVLGSVCFCLPRVARAVYVGWMIAVFPIGWVVSHVILAVIFYAVFMPFGLVMRLCGYDPMTRRFDREAATYWIPRTGQPDPEQYFRQF